MKVSPPNFDEMPEELGCPNNWDFDSLGSLRAMSAVFADHSAREAFQVLLQKRKLESMGLTFLQNKQKRGSPDAAAAPGALGSHAPPESAFLCRTSPGLQQLSFASALGEPSAPGAAAASGEQDREQGSPSTGAAAAAKNIVLPSFWQEMTKFLEDQDRWISMRMQELKKYSLSAHTDLRLDAGASAHTDLHLDADAGEVFDCFNDNLSWEPCSEEYGGLVLWSEQSMA